MSKRNYNVFFNTHTISGIVISVALYVIFFAGAFALFKDEIKLWEEGKHISHVEKKNIDYDRVLEHLDEKYSLDGRDLQINLNHHDKIMVSMSPKKDTLVTKKNNKRILFYVDINTLEKQTYVEQYSLGEFLFRLHYFSQLPYIGIYLAGFISLFFLFAIITGVIVHWKKIISNFYNFNPKIALKRVWTDAHTALGIIGLPFQFIFAITGAYLGIGLLVLLPATFLYNGDQTKLIDDLRPDRKNYEWIAFSKEEVPSLNLYAKKAVATWNNFHLKRFFIKNYGGVNMKYIVSGELESNKRFIGIGRIIYDAKTGTIEEIKKPDKLNYLEDSQLVIGRLHFAHFGGVWVKILYFILAFITCFVIITGVLIWIEARNKKSMTLKQRLYTAKVGHIYLAICLSLYPVIALFFLVVKLLPKEYMSHKMNILYTWFFLAWLLFTIYLRFKRNNYFTNKITLLIGAVLGFLIPIVNGIISNNWIWNAYKAKQIEILTIDVLWIFISTTALFVYFKIKPEAKEQSAFTKHPIDSRNRKELLAEESQKTHSNIKENTSLKNKNHISMRTKIIILWVFLAIGWIVHHMYGLFNVYYKETIVMEGATGEVPLVHHIYRIVFEGVCLLFGLLTIEVSKKWFKIVSLIWAIIAGLYNFYHVTEALLYETTNISEIFMLLLVVIASLFLINNLWKWNKKVN